MREIQAYNLSDRTGDLLNGESANKGGKDRESRIVVSWDILADAENLKFKKSL
jgi:hypothetical protein